MGITLSNVIKSYLPSYVRLACQELLEVAVSKLENGCYVHWLMTYLKRMVRRAHSRVS